MSGENEYKQCDNRGNVELRSYLAIVFFSARRSILMNEVWKCLIFFHQNKPSDG